MKPLARYYRYSPALFETNQAVLLLWLLKGSHMVEYSKVSPCSAFGSYLFDYALIYMLLHVYL